MVPGPEWTFINIRQRSWRYFNHLKTQWQNTSAQTHEGKWDVRQDQTVKEEEQTDGFEVVHEYKDQQVRTLMSHDVMGSGDGSRWWIQVMGPGNGSSWRVQVHRQILMLLFFLLPIFLCLQLKANVVRLLVHLAASQATSSTVWGTTRLTWCDQDRGSGRKSGGGQEDQIIVCGSEHC